MNNTRKRTLAWIAALAAINFLAAELYGLTLFNVARVVLAISGGWYLVARNDSGLGFSMLAGLVVFVTDHLVLTSISFLWMGSFQFAAGELPMALLGVVFSFLMFAPLAAMLALVGGAAARLFHKRA